NPGKLPETFLGLRQCLLVVRVEAMPGVARVVHHDLRCHLHPPEYGHPDRSSGGGCISTEEGGPGFDLDQHRACHLLFAISRYELDPMIACRMYAGGVASPGRPRAGVFVLARLNRIRPSTGPRVTISSGFTIVQFDGIIRSRPSQKSFSL